MNALYKVLDRIIRHNTVWMFLTLLLFFSYTIVHSGLQVTFIAYIRTFVLLCLLYIPVLGFILWRKSFYKRLSRSLFILIWFGCFVVTPAILFVARGSAYGLLLPSYLLRVGDDSAGIMSAWLFGTIWVVIIIVEIVIQLNEYFKVRSPFESLSKYFSVDSMMLALVVLVALALSISVVFGKPNLSQIDGQFSLLKASWVFISSLIQFIIMLLIYYFYYAINKDYLIPKILKEKGIVEYVFSVAAVILLFYPLFVSVIKLLPILNDVQISNFVNRGLFAGDGGFFPFLIMATTVPIIVSNEWYKQRKTISDLERAKTQTELSLLKQQINPHFFFNTLNNLYALSITEDRQTPEVILQLSELMRYVIYKGKEKRVLLSEEIKYIEGYVQLQLIRMHQKVNYTFEKNVDDDISIPPLLLITFVENAFKHGLEPSEAAGMLELKLSSSGGALSFTCINSVDADSNDTPVGIGLSNLKRRLDIGFSDSHELSTNLKDEQFTAILKISKL